MSASDGTRIGPLFSERGAGVRADAVFKVGTSPVIVFKSHDSSANELDWHGTIWNFGVAPLLWVTTPQYIRLYNGYQPPESYGKISPLLAEYELEQDLNAVLRRVSDVCGRRHVAMGGFWRSDFARKIDRRSRVDNILLAELGALLKALVAGGLRPQLAQKLVGRCIFFQYLVHRGYISTEELSERFGGADLSDILKNINGTYDVFRWIRSTFKGDLFPLEDEEDERRQIGRTAAKLRPLSDFFGHFNITDGQGRLFPFRFDAIPVELISSIYEKFVHLTETDGEDTKGVHYTPINLVDLVLDPVFEGMNSSARVLDPACGSGVFLVESLRRIAWLRSKEERLTGRMIKSILQKQIRGVDISPAALSVAAFGLYLAQLELGPRQPKGIEELNEAKFDKLINKVLFCTSAFNPYLDKLLATSGGSSFDVIVGNPPWTYDPASKSADRLLEKKNKKAQQTLFRERMDPLAGEDPARRTGSTYARLRGLPLPPRSNDWAFLWRCRDFSHDLTRVALVLKATPFFSLEKGASTRRDALFRSFANAAVVNLSQLRLSRLFQEYEADAGKKKSAAGPALLFFSNCLPTDPGMVTVVNMPWTPAFAQSGVFELPSDPSKGIPIALAASRPELFKAAIFGEERDLWFLSGLPRNANLCRLADFATSHGAGLAQGYQQGKGYSARHLRGLPKVAADNYRPLRLRGRMEPFADEEAYRPYTRDRYLGPLVLMPEGGLTLSLERGRYSAAFDQRDLLYNESIVGISFPAASAELAGALALVMNSAFIAYQLALTACTLGIKQTKVERVDLDNIFIPDLSRVSKGELKKLLRLEGDLLDPGKVPNALLQLDNLVCDLCDFSPYQRALLSDASRRARAIVFETPKDRLLMDEAPTPEEISRYAQWVAGGVNEYAEDPRDLALTPVSYAPAANDLVAVKFKLVSQHALEDADPVPVALDDIRPLGISIAAGGPEFPYLRPLRSLRLYFGDTLIIAKPARYRCFSAAVAWSDGDRIISDLMSGVDAEGAA